MAHMKTPLNSEEKWSTAPSPADKRAACGTTTLITLYTNGTFSVIGFNCHRWDCERCASSRREEIKRKIIRLLPEWHVKSVSPSEYIAAQKRIERAGAKYCALGTGDSWLFLVNKPVLDGSNRMGGEVLDVLIDESLKGPHTLRQRRFRHSDGLFPKGKREFDVHIERKIVIAGDKRQVLAELEKDGHRFSRGWDGADYVIGRVKSEEFRKSIYSKEGLKVEWIE